VVTYPEYVIDEESTKQDAAGANSVQLQKLNAIQCKRQSKQIIGNPVLNRQGQNMYRNSVNY